MFAVYVESNDLEWEVMIFRKRRDAEEWLRHKVREKHQVALTFG